jgi:hypothetical protein
MCGRPAQGGNLCPGCSEDLRANLTKIADRWPDLEQALTTPGTGGEQGKTRNGMIAVGTNVNEAAVRARRACTDAVWFAFQVIREDAETAGKPFNPPRITPNRSQDDTPVMARWLAVWQVTHITHRTSQESAEEIARDVAQAEHLTYQVCETTRPRKVPLPLGCVEHGTSPLGERVPCPGRMDATIDPDSMPDLVCTVDPTHRIPPDVWSRNYWRSHHVPMDEGAARNLLRRITG